MLPLPAPPAPRLQTTSHTSQCTHDGYAMPPRGSPVTTTKRREYIVSLQGTASLGFGEIFFALLPIRLQTASTAHDARGGVAHSTHRRARPERGRPGRRAGGYCR